MCANTLLLYSSYFSWLIFSQNKLHKKENPKCFQCILILAYVLQNYHILSQSCKTGFYSLHSFVYSLETLSTASFFLSIYTDMVSFLYISSQPLFSSLFCLMSIVTPVSYHFHLHKTSFSKPFLSCCSLFKFVSIGPWNVNNLYVASWYASRIQCCQENCTHKY